MDLLPNIDGVEWFASEVLPLIHYVRPECTVAIVGRTPPRSVWRWASGTRIQVTGTAQDIRPYLWSSSVSIVPLRIGGGTRLKIYESMAARSRWFPPRWAPRGWTCTLPRLWIADSAGDFAEACLELLADKDLRERQAAAAWEMASRLSWERVARCFEQVMELAP